MISFVLMAGAKRQLLEKIYEYEQLAHMDPLLLEKIITSWNDSSEDESGNCTKEDNLMKGRMHYQVPV